MDPALTQKALLYRQLAPGYQYEAGFVTDDCDALLFSALGAVGGLQVDLTAARNEDGEWFRTPQKDCYPNKSSSSISRDMLLGVMIAAWASRDLDMAERLYKYGADHLWIMGSGFPSRTFFNPEITATLAQLSYKLGGPDRAIRNFPVSWSATGISDFEAHLQVLHIILRRAIYDKIEPSAQEVLNAQATRQPENALFQWAALNTPKAVELLKDTRYWPSDRLPNSGDRCEQWLFQRDSGSSDWLPCEGETPDTPSKIYTGADFLFVERLIELGL